MNELRHLARLSRQWRLARGLTQRQLAELTGYAHRSVCAFEAGEQPSKAPIASSAWRRWERACASVDEELRGNKFNWGLEHARVDQAV